MDAKLPLVPLHPDQIDMNSDSDVRFWTSKLRTTPIDLARAVRTVGTTAVKVAAHLKLLAEHPPE
jgi:Protein of unknown function (DUF3606)